MGRLAGFDLVGLVWALFMIGDLYTDFQMYVNIIIGKRSVVFTCYEDHTKMQYSYSRYEREDDDEEWRERWSLGKEMCIFQRQWQGNESIQLFVERFLDEMEQVQLQYNGFDRCYDYHSCVGYQFGFQQAYYYADNPPFIFNDEDPNLPFYSFEVQDLAQMIYISADWLTDFPGGEYEIFSGQCDLECPQTVDDDDYSQWTPSYAQNFCWYKGVNTNGTGHHATCANGAISVMLLGTEMKQQWDLYLEEVEESSKIVKYNHLFINETSGEEISPIFKAHEGTYNKSLQVVYPAIVEKKSLQTLTTSPVLEKLMYDCAIAGLVLLSFLNLLLAFILVIAFGGSSPCFPDSWLFEHMPVASIFAAHEKSEEVTVYNSSDGFELCIQYFSRFAFLFVNDIMPITVAMIQVVGTSVEWMALVSLIFNVFPVAMTIGQLKEFLKQDSKKVLASS